jgi:hypothetical protein
MPRTPGYRVRQVGTLAEEPVTEDLSNRELTVDTKPAPSANGQAVGGSYPPERQGPARRLGALSIVAALGVAGTIGFGLAWGLSDTGPSTNTAVSDAARNLVLALTNFNPGTISSDFSRVQSQATGPFAKQAKRVFGSAIRKELTAAHAASRGTIEDLYIQSVSGSHASVFAVVSQRYLNTKTTTPVRDTLRMVIGLRKNGGNWLISSVRVLEQPVSAVTSK